MNLIDQHTEAVLQAHKTLAERIAADVAAAVAEFDAKCAALVDAFARQLTERTKYFQHGAPEVSAPATDAAKKEEAA